MSSCPGGALCVVFSAGLFLRPSRGWGPAASRGTAEHQGLFLGAVFRSGPVCGRARLLRAGGKTGSGVRADRPGLSLPSLLPGTASPSPQRRGLQISGEQITAEPETENTGWKQVRTARFAVGQADLPSFLDGEVPALYPTAAIPRASLGNRHRCSRAAGTAVPWEEENEEDNLLHPGRRVFPAPRLKARGRANSLAQVFGVFSSYMELLTLRWKHELKV